MAAQMVELSVGLSVDLWVVHLDDQWADVLEGLTAGWKVDRWVDSKAAQLVGLKAVQKVELRADPLVAQMAHLYKTNHHIKSVTKIK